MSIWDGATVTAMEVTPKVAGEFMSRNVFNREMNPEHTQELCDLHEAGEFVVNGDTVRFGTFRENIELPHVDVMTGKRDPSKPLVRCKKGQEVLLDGQNRLSMVILTGKPARLLVVRGLDPVVQKTMDQNTPRRVADMLRCDVERARAHDFASITSRHAAIGRTIMELAYGLDPVIKQRIPDVIKQHMAGIQFVVKECFKSAATKRLTHAPLLTVMVQAYYNGVDLARLVRFGEVVLTGQYNDADHATAAVALRNRLLTSDGVLKQRVVYRLTQSALSKFLAGQDVAKLYEAEQQLFPLRPTDAEHRARRPAAG